MLISGGLIKVVNHCVPYSDYLVEVTGTLPWHDQLFDLYVLCNKDHYRKFKKLLHSGEYSKKAQVLLQLSFSTNLLVWILIRVS